MADMSEAEYRALMAQQAREQMAAAQDPSGQMLPAPAPTPVQAPVQRPDMSQLVQPVNANEIAAANAASIRPPAPVQQPAVETVPASLARLPESDASQTSDTEQETPERSYAASQPMRHGNPYDRLAGLSNDSTLATLQGLQENQGKMYDAMQEAAAAKRKEAEYNAATDTDIAKINQGFLDQQQALQAQNALKEQERQKAVDAQMQKYEGIKDDYLNSKIDPDGAWKHGLFGDNMTANKVVAAIGLFISGFGGPNAVQATSAQINKAIDRDIAIQNQQIARKGKALDVQHNIVGMYRAQYQDQLQADLASKMALQEQAINTIEQRRMNAKSQQDINSADTLIAAMKGDFAKTQNEFLKASNEVITRGLSQQGIFQNLKDENAYRRDMLAAKEAGREEKLTPQQSKVYDELVKIKNGLDVVHAGAEKYKNATGGIGESVKQYIPGTDAYDYRQFSNASAGEMAPGFFPGTRQNAYTEQRSKEIIPGLAEPKAKGNAVYGEKLKEGVGQMHNRIAQLKAMHAPQSVIDDAESMVREFGGNQQPETRNVGGHTYVKVKGGWQRLQ